MVWKKGDTANPLKKHPMEKAFPDGCPLCGGKAGFEKLEVEEKSIFDSDTRTYSGRLKVGAKLICKNCGAEPTDVYGKDDPYWDDRP